jgi:NAD(P)H-hydrate epimerase
MTGMKSPFAAIYSAQQVRELDRHAIQVLGIPGYELMTRAGHAALNTVKSLWAATKSLCVLCGPGNNGGDGYVVARVARAQGLRVTAVSLCDPQALAGDARQAYDDFVASGGHLQPWTPQALEADAIVDAIFGTGLTREVSGLAAEVIEDVNFSRKPVVAVDIPSGLHADSGALLGATVRADVTVTFIGRKLGCYLGRGPDCVGRIVFDDLGVPSEAYRGRPASAELLDDHSVALALPRRARTAHKGDHGHVLVIGGGPGMPGAARLAGEAALRAGAGLVTVATHPANVTALSARPELMAIAAGDATELAPALERATVLALGPGLGQSAWAREMHAAVLAAGKPMIVDADALNLLAGPVPRRGNWVLTPHPGEAARLLGTGNVVVQRDRLAAAQALLERYGGTIVLKGAGTIVLADGSLPAICDRGNPGMAAAGMGDVLTGVIAGIAAQCGDLPLAAKAGVFAHAQAGDLAARRGERGLLASDVLDSLRACVNPA